MLLGSVHDGAGSSPYPLGMSAKTSIREVLATNLRALMKRRGWTQEQLGKKAGISQTHVGNVLRKEVDPTTAMIAGFSRAFDIPEWLLLVPQLPVEILDSPEVPNLIKTYLEAAAKPLSAVIAERAAHQNR